MLTTVLSTSPFWLPVITAGAGWVVGKYTYTGLATTVKADINTVKADVTALKAKVGL